uniref:SOCS box domain-containing protein n=1 Tax=Ficedula albicollis TaxID=59894 RepID=A0A803WCX8_FICAL
MAGTQIKPSAFSGERNKEPLFPKLRKGRGCTAQSCLVSLSGEQGLFYSSFLWDAAAPSPRCFQGGTPEFLPRPFPVEPWQPRCLQHWCRSALRSSLGSRCHSLVPLLPLPRALQGFLLLEPQGVVL